MSRTATDWPLLPDSCWLVDTHCHLDLEAYAEDLEEVIRRAGEHGVRGIITVGTDLQSSRRAIRIATRWPGIRALVGIHPHDAGNAAGDDLEELGRLAESHPELVVGYGEIGLDYAKRYSDPETQRRLFRRQLRLAAELKLPVIIHDREAHHDTMTLIRESGPLDHGGIMHCFSGDLELARQAVDCNLLVSIPGIVTFKKAAMLQEVAAQLPLEHLVLETDGPFLAPVPFRGKRNEPAYTVFTAAAVAALRKLPLTEVTARTTGNCCNLFGTSFDH